MKKYILILGLILFIGLTQFGSNFKSSALTITQIPADFEFDGCSLFPDGDYGECCIQHDKPYFFGGNWKQRFIADNELYSCIKKQGSWYHQILAPVMWIGVRIGGAPVFPTSYRWGFGRDRY